MMRALHFGIAYKPVNRLLSDSCSRPAPIRRDLATLLHLNNQPIREISQV
jgi:hypothetical protein